MNELQRVARASKDCPLLERDGALTAAQAALDRLCGEPAPGTRHSGGVLVIAGAPGVGKTRLVSEVRRRAEARGASCLSASGAALAQYTPFQVARALLHPVLARYPRAERCELLGGKYDVAGPVIGLHPAAVNGLPPDPQGVSDALGAVTGNLALRHGPLVLAVDDLHWADTESLNWLSALVKGVADLPLLVVVAYRPHELPPEGEAFRAAPGRAALQPINLAPLSAPAVGELTRDILGARVDDAFCREAWVLTGGNPFEAVELAIGIRNRGIDPAAENVPKLSGIVAATRVSGIGDRLHALGTDAMWMARAAAVLGTDISLAMTACLANFAEAKARPVLERLRAERILVSDGDRLEFVHPLIATAVYQDIPPGIRMGLHCAAAALLGPGSPGGRGSATAAARHLLEIYPESDPQVVCTLRAAAREYTRTGALGAARRCLERALREPPPPEQRATVLYELGCAAQLSDPAATVTHLRAALAEPHLDVEVRSQVVIRLSQALAYCGRLTEAARLLANEARSASDAKTGLRLWMWQLMWSAFSPEEAGAPARKWRLTRLADRVAGTDLTERCLLGLRAWDAVVRGEPVATPLSFAMRAVGNGVNWVDKDWSVEVHMLTALTFVACERPDRAEKLFTEGIEEYERRGWCGSHLAYAYALLGYFRYRRGLLADAERCANKALRLASRVGPGVTAKWYAAGTLIKVLIARGQIKEARAVVHCYHYREPFPPVLFTPDPRAVLGELLLAEGKYTEAALALSAAGSRLEDCGISNPACSGWLSRLALACARHDLGLARSLAGQAVARAERFGAPTAIGQALLAAGRLTKGDAGLAVLERAVNELEESPSAYQLACALAAYGSRLRRAGHARRAAEELHRAADLAAWCHADSLAARASAELASTGLPRRALATHDADSLTVRELTVAERAADGWPNDRISADLRLGTRRVKALLSSVYAKLGTDRGGLGYALGSTGNYGRSVSR